MNEQLKEFAITALVLLVLMGCIAVAVGYWDIQTATTIHGHCVVQVTTNGWGTVLHKASTC